ncbi:hypothetical protein RM764_44225, partial [Streptomyces sp. DSM 41699]|nr:hypothetical protein [Streptomyces sp. DSM 41699]
MSRLSREPERGSSAAVAASMEGTESGMTPIEVHVPVGARDGAPDAGTGIGTGATVGGMPVVAAPGESVQQAVLNHLHRLALTAGHPVLAAVRDERIGYVVSVRVLVDGSSEFTGVPTQLDTPDTSACPADAAIAVDVPERPGAAVATCMVQAAPEQEPLITATSGPAQVWPRAEGVVPGTVQPPTGTFGPPTGIFIAPTGTFGSQAGAFGSSAGALGLPPVTAPVWPAPATEPDDPQTPEPDFGSGLDSRSAPEWQPAPAPAPAEEPKA